MNPTGRELTVVIPVFNDWEAVTMLLCRLDEVLQASGLGAQVLLVDDGSTAPVPDALSSLAPGAISRVDVLRLLRNLGHQRAIAIGLTFVRQRLHPGPVLVMDADGEDRPEDVPRLYRAFREHDGQKIVFAARTRRSEGLAFKVFYVLYRWAHKVLTGQAVRVGNFSILPWERVSALVVVTELWSHYAAAVLKARLPFTMIPTSRGARLTGTSSMNFVSLVTHGLTAISVFSELVGVRLLCAAAGLVLSLTLGLLTVLGLGLFTDVAIPAGTTYALGTLVLAFLQALMLVSLFAFFVLSNRTNLSFVPVRDYRYFIRDVREIYSDGRAVQLRRAGA